MYSTQAAVAFAGGGYPTIRNFNRSVSRKGSVLRAFYLNEVLTANPSFPSRNINDLVTYAWLNALVP